MRRKRPEIERLEQAVAKLSPLPRDVYLMMARDGYDMSETAALLGLETDAVELHLAHALMTLTRLLDDTLN